MPGHDRTAGEKIERDWYQRGFEDAQAGKPKAGPDEWSRANAAGMGLNTGGAYDRGYEAGKQKEEA